MIVELHNWPVSAGYECTGCPEVLVQDASLCKAQGGEEAEGSESRFREKKHAETRDGRRKRKKDVVVKKGRDVSQCIFFTLSPHTSHSLSLAHDDIISPV